MRKKILNCFNRNDAYTTKEVAKMIGENTTKTYRELQKMEDDELMFCMGYRTKNGTVPRENKNLSSRSLVWQYCPKDD